MGKLERPRHGYEKQKDALDEKKTHEELEEIRAIIEGIDVDIDEDILKKMEATRKAVNSSYLDKDFDIVEEMEKSRREYYEKDDIYGDIYDSDGIWDMIMDDKKKQPSVASKLEKPKHGYEGGEHPSTQKEDNQSSVSNNDEKEDKDLDDEDKSFIDDLVSDVKTTEEIVEDLVAQEENENQKSKEELEMEAAKKRFDDLINDIYG